MRKHYKNTTSGLSGMMKIKWTDDKMKIVPGRDKRWTAAAGRGGCQGRRRRVWGASCDWVARVPWFQAGHWIILHQTTNLIINLKCGLPLTNHFYAKSNFRGTSFDSERFFYLYIYGLMTSRPWQLPCAAAIRKRNVWSIIIGGCFCELFITMLTKVICQPMPRIWFSCLSSGLSLTP